MFFPVQFKAVETNHVFKVHENNPQRIQLVCQPKVCKANAMKWCCHHSKLEEKVQTVIPLEDKNLDQIASQHKIHIGL